VTNHPKDAPPITGLELVAIAALDAIPPGDNETAHVDAEAVLLALVHPEVQKAWERAKQRVGGFWYA
jgi:hypothetical protein